MSKYKFCYSIGVMTGTSADGADMAALKIDLLSGAETLGYTANFPFSPALRERILKAQKGAISVRAYAELQRDYSMWLGVACKKFLKRSGLPANKSFFSIHGQTLWHQPPVKKPGFSLQMLDASWIAQTTGLCVVHAFRQSDLTLNGHGAPLVPYYQTLKVRTSLLAKSLPLAIHNIGGISNLTYISKNNVIAFDTGPGNCLIDLAMKKTFSKNFDFGGNTAQKHLRTIDWALVKKLSNESYFKAMPPKSTGRELFDETYLKKIPLRGGALVANLTALTAYSIAKAYVDFILNKNLPLKKIYVFGGGSLNKTLLELIEKSFSLLNIKNLSVETLPESFAPAQSLEAMAFARLGFEALKGNPISLKQATGARADARGASLFLGANFKFLKNLF